MFPLTSAFRKVSTFLKIIERRKTYRIQTYWNPANTENMVTMANIGN